MSAGPGGGLPPLRAAVLVWAVAEVAYVCAVAARTSLGVAGVEAMERFSMSASTLAFFSSLQVGVYGLAQVPVGLALDRWGPRRLLTAGAVLVALAQAGMALSTSVPAALTVRVLLGIGDATAFVSVLRLLPNWFPSRRIPLFTQLTSILGLLGQIVSAVPFMAVLHHFGWSTAFALMSGLGFAASLCAFAVVRDAPPQAAGRAEDVEELAEVDRERVEGTPGESVRQTLSHVVRSPWSWLGFFTHWSGAGPSMTFTLLWGVPLMTLGMGMPAAQASAVLVAFTVVNIAVGPLVGQLTARRPRGRVPGVLLSAAASGLAWVLVLAPGEPPPAWSAWVLAAVLSVSGVSSSVGFDFVRQGSDPRRLGTATGWTNMGGFLCTLLCVQSIGWMLDRVGAGGAYTWADFRIAMALQGITWSIGVVGVLVSSRLLTRSGGWRRYQLG